MENQNEIIKQCLQLGYSTGGSPELAELTAEANGVGAEYNKLVMRLTICSNEIIAGMDRILSNDNNRISFNVFIRSNADAVQYNKHPLRLVYLFNHVVASWINQEPLRLAFVVTKSIEHPLALKTSERLAYMLAAARRLEHYITNFFAVRKSDWVIDLQINHEFSQRIIAKGL